MADEEDEDGAAPPSHPPTTSPPTTATRDPRLIVGSVNDACYRPYERMFDVFEGILLANNKGKTSN